MNAHKNKNKGALADMSTSALLARRARLAARLPDVAGVLVGSCRRSAASRRISGPVDTCCRRPSTDW